MAFFQAGLRRALVQVPKSPFACRQCLKQTQQKVQITSLSQSRNAFSTASRTAGQPAGAVTIRPAALLCRNSSRASSFSLRGLSTSTTRQAPAPSKPLSTAATTEATASTATAPSESSSSSSETSNFPDTSSKAAAYWLIASAVSVFGIVVWGGLTRLTESGLSITEWKPVTGAMPPRNEEDWEAEFTKYRASPEYARLNPNMTLEEFKKIYFMEWSHRLWGRFIGMSFVIPAIYFVARRRVTKRIAWNLLGIAGLIGFQGFIGWWMVASGLRDELFSPGAQPPRVSQYRLTAHLATAFVCYSWMLLTGLSILRDLRVRADPAAAAKVASTLSLPALRPFRFAVMALTALVFTTVLSGALVAGLDAGLIYNEFPMMGNGITPPRAELWDAHYSRKPDHSDLWWRNMLENPSLVQLDHRILATTTFCAVMALFAFSRTGRAGALLPRNVKKGATGVVHLVLMQATLGICTLIYMVPTHLAATHQAGSLALLTGVLVLGHRLRMPKSTLRLIEKYATKAPHQPNLGSRVTHKA
ncbi:Cytochrome c oxidase assembly protein cox15 [Sporothrix bragantina]|uniref:Cytochrome c oxidase assembly protein cox15 n=1 Tax=Sporothrix bragantina TaxID=671064 RepID=A0ABP0CPD0_9PEZI